MTAYRLPIARSLPPTAKFWATYVGGGEPSDYPVVALFLHLLYGVGGGCVFAALARASERPPTEGRGVAAGALFGAILSVFGTRVVLGRLLGMSLEPDESLVFHVSHLIYGLTLGTWVGSRLRDEGGDGGE